MTAAGLEKTTVYAAGEGGYGSIRIPSLSAHADDVVLAFAEGRRA